MLYPSVYDTFQRSDTGTWGTSTSGHTWTNTVAGDASTTVDALGNGYALHTANALGVRIAAIGPNVTDFEVTVQVGVSAFATGARISAGLVGRYTDSSNYYYARIDFNTDQVIGWQIRRVAAGVDGLILANLVTGIKHVPGGRYWLTFKGTGTQLQLSAWSDAIGRPPIWTAQATDSALTAAGQVGIRSELPSGNTNPFPLTWSYSYFAAGPYVYLDHKPLLVDVDVAFGADLTADPAAWVWTPVTQFLRQADQVKLGAGRGDGSSQAEPANGTVAFNNDGRFSEDQPESPYYPNVVENTPIRVRVMVATVLGIRYANGWAPGYLDNTARNAIATVQMSGLLRRINQGKSPLLPPYQRALVRQDGGGSIAYGLWMLADGSDSTQAASAIVGGAPMTVRGAPGWAAQGGPQGNAVDLAPGCTLIGQVVGASSTAIAVEFLAKFAQGNGGTDVTVVDLTGTSGRYSVSFSSNGIQRVWTYSDGSVSAALLNGFVQYDGLWHHYRFTLSDNSGNVTDAVAIDGATWVALGTVTWGVNLGTMTSVRLSPNGTATSLMPQVQALAVLPHPSPTFVDTARAALGYPGELNTVRLARVCAEMGIPITVVGGGTPMGIQTSSTLPDLLHDCEAADSGGLLTDGQGAGLLYVSRQARYNQQPAIVLDRLQGHIAPPYQPVSDDQVRRNDWTLTRTNGSSAQFVLDDGSPKSIQRIGVYDASDTINIATDSDLPYHCQWRVHLGTVKGYRYPTFSMNLAHHAAGPALVGQWLGAYIGSLMTVEHPPTQEPPDDILNIIEGWTQTLDEYTWNVDANCSAGRAWEVFQVEHTRLGRLDSDGVTLHQAYNATATSLQVDVVGPLVATGSDTFDLDIAGERVTVTNVTGSSSPQTLTVTRSVNGVVKAQAAGAPVRLWRPGTLAL